MNAVAKQTPATNLVSMFHQRKPEFSKLLPKSVTPDTFMRTLENAILRDPGVAEADPKSVFLEVMKCAADGLVLDGREATLTRYKTKDKGTIVTYIPMILGLRKRLLKSGQVRSLVTGLVYEQEVAQGRFRYRPAMEQPIDHEPLLTGNLGPIVAAYSLVKLSDGTWSAEVMRIDQLEGIRKRSRAANGPWSTDTTEMYKKTVVRRHVKQLPLPEEYRVVAERVDDLYDMSAPQTPEDVPVTPVPPKKQSAAEKLKKAKEEPKPEPVQEPEEEQTMYDQDTGEIQDADYNEIPEQSESGEDVF